MYNNAQIKILSFLLRNPLEFYSIRQLSKEVNLAYPYVYNSIKDLKKKELITIKAIGKSNLCQVKFSNPDDLAIASALSTQCFLTHHLSINNLTNQLKEALTEELYILLLFGSYAKGKATKSSDIDLFFIVKDEDNIEKFKKKVKTVLSTLNYPVEFEVSTMNWFYEMLGDKNTVGREIFKNNIVLNNPEAYFYLVKKYDQQQRY